MSTNSMYTTFTDRATGAAMRSVHCHSRCRCRTRIPNSNVRLRRGIMEGGQRRAIKVIQPPHTGIHNGLDSVDTAAPTNADGHRGGMGMRFTLSTSFEVICVHCRSVHGGGGVPNPKYQQLEPGTTVVKVLVLFCTCFLFQSRMDCRIRCNAVAKR